MQKTTILYISYDGMTDSLGQSQVLPYLTGLSGEYAIHLISFEKKERFETFKSTIQTICDTNGITWHPLNYTKTPPVLSTIYDVRQMFRKAKQLDKEHAFTIVHCRSYISALVGLSFKLKKGKKFIFDMRGFYADERVDGGLWNLNNPLFKQVYNYFKRKERAFLIHSDAIVSLTENGKKELLSWNLPSVTSEKITVIPCCVNTELFQSETIQEEAKNKLRLKLNLKQDDFVLGYVGSIGTWYMLPEMLDYFKVLLTEKPTAKFLFVTAESPGQIVDLAEQKGIDKQSIRIERCLHQEVPLYVSLFDQSIFFIVPSYSKKASSPTKQGELMAMGIPTICNVGVGDSDMIAQKYNAGYLVESFTEEAYLKTVRLSLETPFDSSLTRNGACNFYGLEQGIGKYRSIYKQLADA